MRWLKIRYISNLS